MKAHRGKLIGGLVAAVCLALSWWQQQQAPADPTLGNAELEEVADTESGAAKESGTQPNVKVPVFADGNKPAETVKEAPQPNAEQKEPAKVEAAEAKVAAVPKRSSDPIIAKMQSHPLRYTRHARCRMDCRKISEAEVQEILQTGHIDNKRTRTNPGQCTTYAVEGTTKADNQHVRIVYAACDDVTKVVTTIDLDTDHPCGSC